jgi:polyvinyl alcohol dehydrogenase (cytochrome)
MKTHVALAVTACVLAPAFPAAAQALQGLALYEQHCGACHNAPASASRAPDRDALAQRTPEAILDAITDGAMAVNAGALTPAQKRILAEHLAGRPLGAAASGDAALMTNRCAANPLGDLSRSPLWSGWGPDASNGRFQPGPAAGLTAAQVPKLALKWAFAFPNGSSAYAQPAIAAGRVFVGSDTGFVYSLDAATGCVHWSYRAQSSVRTAVSVGRIGARQVLYFGDFKANVYAIDAETAALVWMKKADPHPLARITGAPTLVDGRLYVPVASLEEASGGNPNYQCCTFRGALVVYDASTGEQAWKAYTIAEPARPTKKNSIGVQQWGPAGAAIWSSPTVDVKRRAVYVATGDAYTHPAADTSDAIMAFDLGTGRRLWVRQFTPNDAYLVGCVEGRDNCPEVSGPDFDFGNSPILRTLPSGKSLLVAGQKSGAVWAIDPDNLGELVWQRKVGRGSALGGLEWGSAADGAAGYFPVADAQLGAQAGGLFALDLATGKQLWQVAPGGADCPAGVRNCTAARSAAVTVIPGVVFSGTTDGVMHAYSTADGRPLWEYNTAREFTTVNGVPGRGGSINGPGPVVAGGMLFTNSGYAFLGFGMPGNVLLAFGVE